MTEHEAEPVVPEADAQPVSGPDVEAIQRLNQAYLGLTQELAKAIVGQSRVIEEILLAIFSRGHALLIGVPGLAKTLMVSSIASVLNLSFKRIQFTPDLMPADITGTDVLEEDHTTGRRFFRFVHGPVFANMILADEINRTPPKTQAALLESMQEHHVTVGERTYSLPEPFFVLATQNPIEQEGTYPLPEAQLDRFMLSINIGYPTKAEEHQIVKSTTVDSDAEVKPVLRGHDIQLIQKIVRRVPVSDHVVDYAVRLTRATRPKESDAPDFVRQWLSWGAGPRAAQHLILAAKARTILDGRYNVSCQDVRSVAHPVLRHRLFTNFNADAEGITPDHVVDKLLAAVPEKSESDYAKP